MLAKFKYVFNSTHQESTTALNFIAIKNLNLQVIQHNQNTTSS